ncbi:protein of unknown function [Maridesulfovibrio hydrothermalis AM13 = DSM 14728]|uniref:Uncharacterized protein n=1 Tax=Maridesulfovibrio hydrothermalis AM13 = DSM 14728 TaxID=1121451 RepID=L0RAW2_9BACT|nr:protein of unknown function [Maridesulfovibrio hydrothermalis AM13 = DSM 14728]
MHVLEPVCFCTNKPAPLSANSGIIECLLRIILSKNSSKFECTMKTVCCFLSSVSQWINKFQKKFTESKTYAIIDGLIYKNTHKKRMELACVVLKHF